MCHPRELGYSRPSLLYFHNSLKTVVSSILFRRMYRIQLSFIIPRVFYPAWCFFKHLFIVYLPTDTIHAGSSALVLSLLLFLTLYDTDPWNVTRHAIQITLFVSLSDPNLFCYTNILFFLVQCFFVINKYHRNSMSNLLFNSSFLRQL